MNCSRCTGCMVEDFLLDMEDSSGPMWLQARRCMNCGNIDEQVLRNNRLAKEAQILASTAPVQGRKAERISLSDEGMAHLAA